MKRFSYKIKEVNGKYKVTVHTKYGISFYDTFNSLFDAEKFVSLMRKFSPFSKNQSEIPENKYASKQEYFKNHYENKKIFRTKKESEVINWLIDGNNIFRNGEKIPVSRYYISLKKFDLHWYKENPYICYVKQFTGNYPYVDENSDPQIQKIYFLYVVPTLFFLNSGEISFLRLKEFATENIFRYYGFDIKGYEKMELNSNEVSELTKNNVDCSTWNKQNKDKKPPKVDFSGIDIKRIEAIPATHNYGGKKSFVENRSYKSSKYSFKNL